MGQGFRSDILRDLYNAALKQGWRPDESRKSGHFYAHCPQCPYREAFSRTGRGYNHEAHAKINSLRKHGFVWKGKGGEHTAPLPGNQATK
mgnify:CR=1 FL=1